jgi:hypothetical protein
LLSYLDHLDEGDGEVKVGEVTANERQREEDTNGNNGSKVDSAVHGDLLPRVQDCGETSKDLGANGCKTEMPCCEEDREACKVMSWYSMAIARRADSRKFSFFSSRMYLLKRMTLELMAIQTLRVRCQLSFLPRELFFPGRDSHDIESGVDAALRRSRLLQRRVDGGQNRLGLLRSLDLARGSFLLHCAECGVLRLRVEEIGTLDGDGPASNLDGAMGEETKNGRRKDRIEI